MPEVCQECFVGSEEADVFSDGSDVEALGQVEAHGFYHFAFHALADQGLLELGCNGVSHFVPDGNLCERGEGAVDLEVTHGCIDLVQDG